jgi:drug/metabolite transporter (DMT)-like permease
VEDSNLKKGLIFGSIAVFTIGLQPVISNARPSVIDPYLFAAITALVEAILFFPIFLLERRKLKKDMNNSVELKELNISLINGWKKKANIKMLILIGLSFSLVPILLFMGYEIAGAINSSLSLKSEIIFALIFGFFILNEKITKLQIAFCFLLFFGLIMAITNCSFNLIELNIGVILILISVGIFTFMHTFTKISFERKELFPSQVVFIRNLFAGILLTSIYFIIFPLEKVSIIFDSNNFPFFIFMGVDYGISLFLWYKTLTYIQIGKASIINSFTPIISIFFSFIILGESFTIFHFLGTAIIIFSIYMIVKQKN